MALSLLIKPNTYSSSIELGNECHLWFLDVSQLPDSIILHNQHILSDNEELRSKSLKHRKLQFIAIREFVRLCLSRYTKISPEKLEVEASAKGKPFLANIELPVKFNLSHCNNVAVLAVCLHDDVGVDIESITRNRSQRNIASRYFHPQEITQLAQMDDTAYNNYFFRLWTLKEAFFKATGDGISAGLDKAGFQLENVGMESADGDAIKAILSADLATTADNWQFYQAFLSSDYCVALAKHSTQPINIHWFNGYNLFQ